MSDSRPPSQVELRDALALLRLAEEQELTMDKINRRWRALSLEVHPDLGEPSDRERREQQMKRLNNAQELLERNFDRVQFIVHDVTRVATTGRTQQGSLWDDVPVEEDDSPVSDFERPESASPSPPPPPTPKPSPPRSSPAEPNADVRPPSPLFELSDPAERKRGYVLSAVLLAVPLILLIPLATGHALPIGAPYTKGWSQFFSILFGLAFGCAGVRLALLTLLSTRKDSIDAYAKGVLRALAWAIGAIVLCEVVPSYIVLRWILRGWFGPGPTGTPTVFWKNIVDALCGLVLFIGAGLILYLDYRICVAD